MSESSLLMTKVVDIRAARRRRTEQVTIMNSVGYSNRREPRRSTAEQLFVQIVKSYDPNLVGTTISCQAVDVSPSGLRLKANRVIPVGCQIDLWVDNCEGPGKFFLSSEVRWVKITDDGCEAGLALYDGAATDIAEWRQVQSR